jgi:hypothetical protein
MEFEFAVRTTGVPILIYQSGGTDSISREHIGTVLEEMLRSGRVEVVPDTYRNVDSRLWGKVSQLFYDKLESVYLLREIHLNKRSEESDGKVQTETLSVQLPESRPGAKVILEGYLKRNKDVFKPGIEGVGRE